MKQLFKILSGRRGMKSKNEILGLLQQLSQESVNLLYYSSVITEFNRIMSNPEVKVDHLSSIIEKDPGLTASVLKMANSSFYGVSKKVGTVKQAISLLGYRTLEKIFTVNLINNALNNQNSNYGDELWKHSLGTAIAAQEIVSIAKPKLAEEAFAAGLLHDIGKFIIMNFMPKEYEQMMREYQKNPYQYSITLENQFIGLDHQQIGAFFAENWHFPESIQMSIRYHHTLDIAPQDKEMISLVTVGNNIAKAMELGESNSKIVELVPRWVWGFIGITKNDFSIHIPLIQQKYNAYLSFLNVE